MIDHVASQRLAARPGKGPEWRGRPASFSSFSVCCQSGSDSSARKIAISGTSGTDRNRVLARMKGRGLAMVVAVKAGCRCLGQVMTSTNRLSPQAGVETELQFWSPQRPRFITTPSPDVASA